MRSSRSNGGKATYFLNGLEVVHQGTFPLLDSAGLLACSVGNDGNCLFRALSDQLTGDENQHLDIRKRVVRFMAANPKDFKAFITLGGIADQAQRPSRSCSKQMFKETDNEAMEYPTKAQHSFAFSKHLARMSQEGTWGDQIEITAFAKCYGFDVKVYWANQGNLSPTFTQSNPNGALGPCLSIGFNEAAQHYYTVRNMDGSPLGVARVLETPPSSRSTSSEQSRDSASMLSSKSSKRTSPEDSEEDEDPISGPVKRRCGMRRELETRMEQQKVAFVQCLALQKMSEKQSREAQKIQAEKDLEQEKRKVADLLDQQRFQCEHERIQREADQLIEEQPLFFDSDCADDASDSSP